MRGRDGESDKRAGGEGEESARGMVAEVMYIKAQ